MVKNITCLYPLFHRIWWPIEGAGSRDQCTYKINKMWNCKEKKDVVFYFHECIIYLVGLLTSIKG